MKTLRQQGRAFALQLLYQTEIGQAADPDTQKRFWENSKASKKAGLFARGLVEQTLAHREEIDRALTAVMEQWRLERLPVVVRNVLRLGACEMRIIASEPVAVVINEAVELTRTFMDEDSARFVNGVLERLHRRVEDPLPPPAAETG